MLLGWLVRLWDGVKEDSCGNGFGIWVRRDAKCRGYAI
jgi:hypothetical protein